MSRPAVFLDRDGVINENRPDHVKCWEEFQFLPGALQALRALSLLRMPIFIVTNQAVINRRLVTRATVDDIHRRMLAQVRRAGARIDGVYCCPHDPRERCSCRKPAPGLLLEAAARFDIDLRRSVLVGDAVTDILAGQRSQCKTVLVLTGRGRESMRTLAERPIQTPTAFANDLVGAVPIVAALLQSDELSRPGSACPPDYSFSPLPARTHLEA